MPCALLPNAEKIVLATSLGAIHFVLRNGADQEQALSPPVGLSQLAGVSSPSPTPQPLTASKALHSRSQYRVETILGDKQVVNEFH